MKNENENYLFVWITFIIILIIGGLITLIEHIGWYTIPVILFIVAWGYVENKIKNRK